jgi:hypothetical protein
MPRNIESTKLFGTKTTLCIAKQHNIRSLASYDLGFTTGSYGSATAEPGDGVLKGGVLAQAHTEVARAGAGLQVGFVVGLTLCSKSPTGVIEDSCRSPRRRRSHRHIPRWRH